MNEKELRAKVVSIAQSYIGCNEKDGSHKKIIDLYNGNKPLPRGYKVTYTDAWCATFGSAVAIQAGLTGIIPPECSCTRQIELFKGLGSWQENDAYVPGPGDYIFYDWQDGANYATTDNRGTPDHVGIVEKVSGNTITVIEGNYSDSVKRRSIQVNGRYIRGYGVPDYASKADKEKPAEKPVENVESESKKEDEEMSYEQFYTWFEKAMDQYRAKQAEKAAPSWSEEEFAAAIAAGITDGKRPLDFLSRVEGAVMNHRTLQASKQSNGT